MGTPPGEGRRTRPALSSCGRYENLDRHMAQAYSQLALTADTHGFMMKDGVRPMSKGYTEAVQLINSRRMGMNLALLTMPGRSVTF